VRLAGFSVGKRSDTKMSSSAAAKALPTLDSALADVEARFLYNLPESELSEPDRLFFQIEQAWWFYEDFMADRHQHLPHFAKLQSFAKKIFSHCPILSNYEDQCEELFNDFVAYKNMIPVFGVIMLSPDMKKMVLVCGWKSNTWTFPRGKVNQNEGNLACAVREALEETGFDASAYCREEDSLQYVEGRKVIKLYIACNVPETAYFETKTRKEISKVAFWPIDALPKSTYGVFPFLPRLMRFIASKQPKKSKSSKTTTSAAAAKVAGSSSSSSSSKRAPRSSDATQFDGRNHDTFFEELSSGQKGWDVTDMFKANALLTGRNYSAYDGNPHDFGSSHPRYKNFNEQLDASSSSASSSSSSSSSGAAALAGLLAGKIKILTPTAFAALSNARSLASIEAEARGAKGEGGGEGGGRRKWPRFVQPFVLDKKGIMAALDAALAASPVTLEDF